MEASPPEQLAGRFAAEIAILAELGFRTSAPAFSRSLVLSR
jgi:hypothetical protein